MDGWMESSNMGRANSGCGIHAEWDHRHPPFISHLNYGEVSLLRLAFLGLCLSSSCQALSQVHSVYYKLPEDEKVSSWSRYCFTNFYVWKTLGVKNTTRKEWIHNLGHSYFRNSTAPQCWYLLYATYVSELLINLILCTQFVWYANVYVNDYFNLYKQRCKWILGFTGNW